MNDRPTADWIPSHVEITIHQARELLLKNKNASSELYVNVQVEKEKLTTSLIPRTTTPQWNFTSEIPLMSLDTTLHLTVRQKGRLGDQFIGHIPIPLRNFNISSKVVTHWYKLGSRPGKIKNKLRGDLQVSIRFLSKWSSSNTLTNGTTPHLEDSTFDPHSPSLADRFANGKHPRRMLTRSKSEMRIKVRDVMSTSLLDGGKPPSTPPLRDRLSSAIRRSFRKKNKTPVLAFQECEDDFTFSHSPTSTPELRKRSNTVNSFLYPHDPSDSDSTSAGTPSEVSSNSPATVRHPSIQVQGATDHGSTATATAIAANGSATNGGGEGSGDTPLEDAGDGAVKLRDKRSEWQRGGKHRWTMNTLPLLSTTPTSNSTHVPGLSPSPSPSHLANSEGGQSPTKDGTDATNEVLTYRAKSNTLALSPHLRRVSDRPHSYSITSSQGSLRSAMLQEQESVSESCSGVTTPTSSSRRNLKDHGSAESGYNTGSSGLLEGGAGCGGDNNVGKTSVVGEESGSEAGGPNGSKKFEHNQASQKTTITSASAKRPRPLTRRNTSAVSNPSRSRHVHARSRLDSADGSGGGVTSSTNRRSAGAGNLSSRGKSTMTDSRGGTPRKKALSPPLSTPNRRLLPATPVRRSEKAHLAATRPKSMIATSATSPTDTTGGSLELAENNTGAPATSPSKAKEDAQASSESTESPTSADETASQLSSKADGAGSGEGSEMLGNLQENSKMKHTVAYKDTSLLSKDGFQPVSVLPPSATEYQSQTLPLRGKQARRRHTEKTLFTQKPDTVEVYVDDKIPRDYIRPMSTDSAHRINRISPQNTKLVHRSSMNYVISPKMTPPVSVVSGGLDEVDGTTGGDVALMDGVCSKTSATSISSTSTGTSSRPSTPSTPKYSTKTPGEIVTGALRNKPRPVGGLKKNIMMYQQNRREVRRSLQENKQLHHRSCFLEELAEDSDKQQLLQPEDTKKRVSSSAGNSPQQLRRNKSAAETLTGLLKNPFNSLRRSRSSAASSRPPSSRPVSMYDMGDLGISPDLLERLHSSKTSQSSTSLEVTDPAAYQKTSAPALLAYRTTASANSIKPGSPGTSKFGTNIKDDKSAKTEPIIRVRTPSMTESSSVKTLTEMDTSLRDSAVSPNPAGATPMSASFPAVPGHSRHTTCSSVDSEGFVSVTSEELTLEELTHQDWSQWSKEDLFKELILSKQALKRKDQELKDVKGYLDNLLLRIMETSPSLLSSTN